MEKELENRLNELVHRISKLKFVSAVFLFGSQIKGKPRKDSDVDIAVIIDKPTRERELKVIGMGSDLFDISILSKLPITIQFRVIKEGKLIFIRDEKAIHNAKIRILREYLDYSVFLNKFYRRMLSNVRH
ncbi:nucleotidyltransferase domain-containing protein [Candidatus Pacearchaeota archaeon]|nr:nucleotidyltransferase domain-containing protein [Candidatus Pacearchaeota archaeon]